MDLDLDSVNPDSDSDHGREEGDGDHDQKPVITDFEVQVATNRRCLICGKPATVANDNHNINSVNDESQRKSESNRSHNGKVTDADLFSCMLRLLNVRKLSVKGIFGESEANEELPGFCQVCREQIEMLNEVRRKLRELERALHLGTLRLKETMNGAEEDFQKTELYEHNEIYYYIRSKILGVHVTGRRKRVKQAKFQEDGMKFEGLDDLRMDYDMDNDDGSVRRSSRKSKISQHSSTRNGNEDLKPVLDLDQNQMNMNVEERSDDDEEELDSVPDTDSDVSFSPGAAAISDFDEEGSELELSETELESPPRKQAKKTKDTPPKKKRSESNDSKKKVERKNNTILNQESQNQKDGRKRRGSYCKEKLKEDPVTGNCVFIDIKFEKLAEEKYKCTQCFEMVNNHSTIKKHVFRTHTDRFVCHVCGQHKASSSDLNKHVREVHEGRARRIPEKNMECPICGKPFGHKTALEFHKVTHYSEQDKREALARGEKLPDYKDRIRLHQCGICGVVFNNITWLKKHEKIKHPKTEEDRHEVQKICPECGKSFSEAYLKAHVERYHSNLDDSVIKPFVCSFCDKRFYSSARLVQHRRTHTGERPFTCEICNKHFITKNRLKYHNMQNHENKKPYPCTNCTAAFVTSYKLRRHIATVHEGKNQKDWNSKKNKEQDLHLDAQSTASNSSIATTATGAHGSHVVIPSSFYF